jgi:quaternary ammonium compound-resistance protein SugE
MSWLYLALAGGLEVVWAVSLRASGGLTRPLPTLLSLLSLLGSFSLLALALRSLPLGAAYAVWTGIGVVGTALVSMLFLGEAASPARLACLGLIAAGILGLKLLASS